MVYSLRSFLLLSTLATAIFAASHDLDPVPTPASLDERAATATSPAPRCWSGTAFPNISQWRSYSELFSIANGTMQYGGNTLGEIANINKAIQNNARSSGIDP